MKVTARISCGRGAAGRDEMGDARGQNARLADAGAGEHQHRPVERFDRAALLLVQALEIARPGAGRGAAPKGSARRGGTRRFGRRSDRRRDATTMGKSRGA